MDFTCNMQNINIKSFDDEILKLTLSLYNHPLFSRKVVDEILIIFNNFISSLFIPFIQNEIKRDLKPVLSDISYHKVQFILEKKKNIFDKYRTEHIRFKIYEKRGTYIPPQIFEIGKESVYVHEGDKTRVELKRIYATHVSLIRMLKLFLETPRVLDQIQSYIKDLSNDKLYVSNIMQGDLWLKKFSNTDKIIFPLFIYFDEFEIGNAMGSHAGEEKLGGVFTSLACLPPHLIAKLSNVFVTTIFHSKFLKAFGNQRVFCKIIEELNILSDKGIKIFTNKKEQTIYFQCMLVLGDNLGLNSICGFSESFTATRYCRFCYATYSECREMVQENKSILRNVESYQTDVLLKDFKSTGLKENCVFNELNNFHIYENFCVDMMHDVSEGIASYTIGNIIHALIQDKVLSLDIINNRIEAFNYPDFEKSNKPRELYYTQGKKRQQIKINQSASELLCLTRYLGLILGDLIPAGNKYWKLYICLRKIIGILTSPKLTRGQIMNLEELIIKHNDLYKSFFGYLKPKMHIWVHYPRIMLLNGPVIHYASNKFERKNKSLKDIAASTVSNINSPYTIAIKHQLQQCYKRECLNTEDESVKLGPVKNNNAYGELKKLIPYISNELVVTTLKHIDILGKKYSEGTVFVIKISSEGPQFGKIKNIFFCNNTIYFHAEEFETLYFNDYYHAYNVSTNGGNILINLNLVKKLPPCTFLIKNEDKLVALRYDI